MEKLLEVTNLKKYFHVKTGLFPYKPSIYLKAVDGLNFSINKGETFSIVGESGCGKSTTAKLILLLEEVTEGKIYYRNEDLLKKRKIDLKKYRISVQAVFQDPISSLEPRMRVGSIVAEPIIANYHLPKKVVKKRVNDALTQVGLSPQVAQRYPHEFSGGQRQRIAIARAIALKPELIILDEPVSALDVSIRAQVMNLLKELQQKIGLSYLLIAHDLGVVRYMSDRIAVMYLGKIVETAPSEMIYNNTMHPYTEALISAALPSHPDVKKEEIILSGEVPSALSPPSGCHFHPRCNKKIEICAKIEPILKEAAPEHYAACHLY